MLLGFLRCIGLSLVTIPVSLAGLLMVAIALPFRIFRIDTSQPFSQYPGTWMMVNLPDWARPWDNLFDGAWGDKRGWWNNNCLEKYGKNCKAFYSMWQWMAVRNNANYFKRVTCGIDVTECNIIKVFGDDDVTESKGSTFQWHLLKAVHRTGKVYPRFKLSYPWPKHPTHAICIDIGWKIKLSHNDIQASDRINDRIKGVVFLITPWKEL